MEVVAIIRLLRVIDPAASSEQVPPWVGRATLCLLEELKALGCFCLTLGAETPASTSSSSSSLSSSGAFSHASHTEGGSSPANTPSMISMNLAVAVPTSVVLIK